MTTLEIILSIIATLAGGANIVQLAQIRSLQRKSAEEANQASSESWRLIVDGNVREITRLQEKSEKADQKIAELTEIVYDLRLKIAKYEADNNIYTRSSTRRVRNKKAGTASGTQQSLDRERPEGERDGQCDSVPMAGQISGDRHAIPA